MFLIWIAKVMEVKIYDSGDTTISISGTSGFWILNLFIDIKEKVNSYVWSEVITTSLITEYMKGTQLTVLYSLMLKRFGDDLLNILDNH